ncbi:UNVERIFIED_CONTAM: hypothetical protein GTU68_067534 [Idotea baltica]|nr:hypothetical protein [Idotea baltica]
MVMCCAGRQQVPLVLRGLVRVLLLLLNEQRKPVRIVLVSMVFASWKSV